MEIVVKITNILQVQEGVSKSGKSWKKVEFLGEEVDSQYPKTICFTCFGEDKVNDFLSRIHAGDVATVSFDIESREFNGRYFTSINMWKVEPMAHNAAGPETQQVNYDAVAAQYFGNQPAQYTTPQQQAPYPQQAPPPTNNYQQQPVPEQPYQQPPYMQQAPQQNYGANGGGFFGPGYGAPQQGQDLPF